MADRSMIFPKFEFQTRCSRIQAELGLRDLDALLLTEAADIFYVTGFLTRFWESPARPWFVIVPREGAPIAVIPAIGVDLMGRTWIEDIRSWSAPDPRDDGITLLAETLREVLPVTDGAIGMPMGAETALRMPLAGYNSLCAALVPHRVVDGTGAIQRVREVKSEAEIAKIRTTCAIAGRVFDRMPDLAQRGLPLDQLFCRFQAELLHEGADWVSYVAGGAGQGGYGDVISPAAAEPLATGDLLMLDTGAVREGYFCDFDRNFAIGPASDAMRRAYDILFAVTEDALTQLQPGQRAADAHRILADGIRRRGGQPLGGRLGHGLGVTLTEWPSFTPLDETELRAGMVLTLEPGMEIAPGCIMVHEENIVLQDRGPILLSPRAPDQLPEIL
ncbi:M24 family metallopeptidase [Epibacterium sp. SM1979]|uniref:M24 family metallopeptidase n=1 Tax=Tritonibacter litoralis TaxID=2662264 RepID=A0A843YKJ0_9RHOB|nr:Xaa-Pro peptidase family protein [Tritonibacter litoralis]MQQ09689.1 M24 family metallopeptidase [Tritonibacter litoralis]